MDQNQNKTQKCEELSHLSDLMDDFVSDEAIEQILDDKSQKEAWYRYQTVRAVLADEHSAYSGFSFTESISAKLANEPEHSLTEQSDNNVVQLNAWHSWKRFTGGLAVAASVAFAMVFSVQFMESPVDDNGFEQATFVVEEGEDTDNMPTAYELTPADTAEQKKLEEIQKYINQARQRAFGVNEQYVSDVRFKSYVVEFKDKDDKEDDEDKPEANDEE